LEAGGEVARKDGDAVDHGVVEVCRDDYFHKIIIPFVYPTVVGNVEKMVLYRYYGDAEKDTLCVVGVEAAF
jgi:hypothetical protein